MVSIVTKIILRTNHHGLFNYAVLFNLKSARPGAIQMLMSVSETAHQQSFMILALVHVVNIPVNNFACFLV